VDAGSTEFRGVLRVSVILSAVERETADVTEIVRGPLTATSAPIAIEGAGCKVQQQPA
jgi:hypothetical protein